MRAPGKGVGKLFDAALLPTREPYRSQPEGATASVGQADRVPQGTLVERIRAGGCRLGGVLTPTGVGTIASVADHWVT